jgi:hypothetical protein
MLEKKFELSGMQQVRLRELIGMIEREIACLSHEGTVVDHQAARLGLSVSWAALVELVAPEDAPKTRTCSFCGHIGLRAATRCGYCWHRLSPGSLRGSGFNYRS